MHINEIFGPTIQGEGRSAGQVATFVRTWGCNLDCAWCDTPYTWDVRGKNGVVYPRSEECTEMTVEEIADKVSTDLVVVTGGEPLLQSKEVMRLVWTLSGARFEVETNGTLYPLDMKRVHYNVSPKLSSSGVSNKKFKLENFLELRDSTFDFKFVVTSLRDLDEIDLIVNEYCIPRDRVWIMPEGRTVANILNLANRIADAAISRKYNVTLRSHVLIWSDQRGK